MLRLRLVLPGLSCSMSSQYMVLFVLGGGEFVIVLDEAALAAIVRVVE